MTPENRNTINPGTILIFLIRLLAIGLLLQGVLFLMGTDEYNFIIPTGLALLLVSLFHGASMWYAFNSNHST
jgi:hypothetical protein